MISGIQFSENVGKFYSMWNPVIYTDFEVIIEEPTRCKIKQHK